MIDRIAEAMLTFDSMTNDKLQKLCYFSYAWYLTFFGKRLFEERFEAWEKGPVCPKLHERYRIFGRMSIPKADKAISEVIQDLELQEFLEAVYDAHGTLKPEELIYLACSEEPWINAVRRMEEGESSVYFDEEIINWNTRKVLRELRNENICFIS